MTVKAVMANVGACKTVTPPAAAPGSGIAALAVKVGAALAFLASAAATPKLRRSGSADPRRQSRFDRGPAGKYGAVAGAAQHCRHN
jgi:hypothetical protein